MNLNYSYPGFADWDPSAKMSRRARSSASSALSARRRRTAAA